MHYEIEMHYIYKPTLDLVQSHKYRASNKDQTQIFEISLLTITL